MPEQVAAVRLQCLCHCHCSVVPCMRTHRACTDTEQVAALYGARWFTSLEAVLAAIDADPNPNQV